MEHRNEIINEPSSKDIFLRNHPVDHDQPPIYSLEEEFAKTKRNRDLRPYLIFFGFICLLIIATMGIAKYLEDKSKQINIDISDFEDLRLKETLSAAKETEIELNRKTEELDSKIKELNDKTKQLKQLSSSFEMKVQKIKEEAEQEANLNNADKKGITRQEEKSYQYGINSFLKEQKATGCVLDARQRRNILLYFPKNPKLSAETIVSLYRAKDEYIGTLKLIPGATGLRAEIADVATNQSIKSFDWFRLP